MAQHTDISTHDLAARPATRWSPVKVGTVVVAAAFLLVGVAGFVPGLTENVDDITFAGPDSGAELLGLFQVSVLHNIVHLLFGVIGLLLLRTDGLARTYLVAGGVVYLLLWLYGVVVDETSDANFVPVNDADDWLHLGLGLAMIGLGAVLPGRDRRERRGDISVTQAHRAPDQSPIGR